MRKLVPKTLVVISPVWMLKGRVLSLVTSKKASPVMRTVLSRRANGCGNSIVVPGLSQIRLPSGNCCFCRFLAEFEITTQEVFTVPVATDGILLRRIGSKVKQSQWPLFLGVVRVYWRSYPCRCHLGSPPAPGTPHRTQGRVIAKKSGKDSVTVLICTFVFPTPSAFPIGGSVSRNPWVP